LGQKIIFRQFFLIFGLEGKLVWTGIQMCAPNLNPNLAKGLDMDSENLDSGSRSGFNTRPACEFSESGSETMLSKQC
jgi:hypothetical protein